MDVVGAGQSLGWEWSRSSHAEDLVQGWHIGGYLCARGYCSVGEGKLRPETEVEESTVVDKNPTVTLFNTLDS
jgi:hypothetical protein